MSALARSTRHLVDVLLMQEEPFSLRITLPPGALCARLALAEETCGIVPALTCHVEEEPMIYEVRTYTLRPGTVAEFEERFAKRLPLREKHSKLGAFWHTEFGPLNQVIHVYPYDGLQQRTAVRAALAQDTARQQLPGGGGLGRGAGVGDY
jgi:hypothetical protein